MTDWEEYSISQVGWTVDLNNQWELATVRQDADTNFQTYQSFSNKGVNASTAKMKVNIAKGISEFTLHYGSYAENSWDYTCIGHLDMDMSNAAYSLTTTSTTVSTSYWKASSRGSQSSTAPNLVATYTIADTSKEHFIWIAYRKDSSANASDDRGYVSFDKRLIYDINGYRRKVQDGYVAQKISDYDYKFFVGEKWVYSEDKETIIKEDPLTATTIEIQPTFNEVDSTFIYDNHIYKKKYYVVNGVQTTYYTFGEDMGEIQGLDIPNYWFNYNFKNYDSSTKTVPNELNAVWKQDLVLQGTPSVSNGKITISSSNAYAQFPFTSTANNPFNRNSTKGYAMTIIYKIANNSGSGDLISNRGYITSSTAGAYNWMMRHKGTYTTLHGTSEVGKGNYNSSNPVIMCTTVDSSRNVTYKNMSDGTSSTTSVTYGSDSGRICFFIANYNQTSTTYRSEPYTGTVYWLFAAPRVLTQAEIQQVINYNEG